MMIDFKLARKEPSAFELRAYLYRILTDSFGLSQTLRERFKSELPGIGDDVSGWDLNAIALPEIRRILEEHHLLPEEIFYFKKEYNPDTVSQNDYKAFPELFTRVCTVSFDRGGLIVMELYNSQIYELYDANGRCLSERCHDLDLGTDGRVLLRTSKSVFWETMQYNGESFVYSDTFDPFDSPSDFPDISGRDLIPEMLPAGSYNELLYDPSKILTNEEVILELENNSNSYHFLQKYYQDNEELAFAAVNSALYAFTFLSERLQSNKEFVLKLITSENENQRLYAYLNDKLKTDIEIVKLCIKSDSHIIRNIAPVSDRELMEEALKDSVFNLEYASDELKADRKLVLGLVRKEWRVLREAAKSLLSDSAFISEAISCFNDYQKQDQSSEEDEDFLPFGNSKIITDLNEVIGYLVSSYPRVLKHIAPASDMRIISRCLEYTHEKDMPFIIDCISEDLKKTKEFWETAVRNSLYMLKNAPLIYRQDKEVVLSAIRYHGELVEFADESLKDEPDIYLAAIRQISTRRGACDPGGIMHLIPEKLMSDKEFLLDAVEYYPHIFDQVPVELRSEREFMLDVIKKTYGWIIKYAAPELQSDILFVVEAAKSNRDILRWLPESTRNDSELKELLEKEPALTTEQESYFEFDDLDDVDDLDDFFSAKNDPTPDENTDKTE